MPEVEIMSQQQQQEVGCQFIAKISMLPVMSTALGYVTSTYGHIKESNSLVYGALATAEKSVSIVAEQAGPVLSKFGGSIQKIDNLACQGLDKLQEKAPIVTKSPEEILKNTKDFYISSLQKGFNHYDGIKNYGNDKVQEIKQYGYQKASQLITSPYVLVVDSVDKALAVTESCIDYYLPPTGDQALVSENLNEKKELHKDISFERIGHLSSKMKKRLHNRAMEKFQNIQMRSQETVSKLYFTVDLIQYARDNIQDDVNQKFHSTIDNVQKNASWLWEELNRNESEEIAANSSQKTVGQQAVSIARRLTKQLVNTYTGLATTFQTFPAALQENIAFAQKYSLHLHNQLTRIKNLNEISTVMLTEFRHNLKILETSILNMLNNFLLKFPEREMERKSNNSMPTS
ncbi:perilipin-2-like [Limulus polyphemus]|uniref:Perilipin-2-like n=1 Tax=Limulus polyphemus TaxID=6850 RepID=A0ABM1T9B5_LIMPO|nr:perilipin-2-like [Limulus polyphemus]XP_022252471.1 perilipin-2-like [Limulus polyphemus]